MRLLLIWGIAFCLLAIPLSTKAQGKIDTYQKVIDDIIANYNKQEFNEIRKHFSEATKGIITEQQVNKIFGGLYQQGGRIISTGSVQMQGTGKIAVPLVFEKNSMQLEMMLPFDTANKLVGLRFLPVGKTKYPQITDTTTVDDIVQPYISTKENAGLTIAVYSNNGEQVFNYGVIERGKTILPDSNTIYEIGSITKVFTSILLADMVKRKLVKYDDPFSRFLPDSIPPIKYQNREITLIDLATHTSGLPAIPDNLEATMKDPLNPYAHYTVQDLYSYLKNVKLERMPGKEYAYSNLGMGLLGEILSRHLKLSYEEAINTALLNRSAMNNTTIKLSAAQEKIFAKGYNEKGSPTPYWNFLTLEGAGAFHSSAKDMLKFVKINLGQGNADLLEVINEAQVKRTDKTALGWHFLTVGKEHIHWHNGGTYGFRSFIGFAKEENIGVVVLSNSGNSVDEIGRLILELLLRKEK